MTVRKYILGIFASLVCTLACQAAEDNYSIGQTRFRDDINQFLKSEGYPTKVDPETGYIHFRVDSTNYVLGINPRSKNPYMISLCAMFDMDPLEDSGLQHLYEEENRINNLYGCVKVSYSQTDSIGDGLLLFAVESFSNSSEDYQSALPAYLKAMGNALRDFGMVDDTPTSVSEPEDDSSVRQISSPSYNKTSAPFLKITGVDLTPTETKVYISYDESHASSNGFFISVAFVSKDIYIKANGRKFKIVNAEGIALEPKKVSSLVAGRNSSGQTPFVLTFPPIPASTKTFDLIEPAGWEFYGITL